MLRKPQLTFNFKFNRLDRCPQITHNRTHVIYRINRSLPYATQTVNARILGQSGNNVDFMIWNKSGSYQIVRHQVKKSKAPQIVTSKKTGEVTTTVEKGIQPGPMTPYTPLISPISVISTYFLLPHGQYRRQMVREGDMAHLHTT